MKRSFKLKNLDCANCAAKMENAAGKIDGVSVNISFMGERITVEADEALFEEKLSEIQRVISGIEPDCEIVR
jgi:copper chaperone CopZ